MLAKKFETKLQDVYHIVGILNYAKKKTVETLNERLNDWFWSWNLRYIYFIMNRRHITNILIKILLHNLLFINNIINWYCQRCKYKMRENFLRILMPNRAVIQKITMNSKVSFFAANYLLFVLSCLWWNNFLYIKYEKLLNVGTEMCLVLQKILFDVRS